jgi:hypothetical protein
MQITRILDLLEPKVEAVPIESLSASNTMPDEFHGHLISL